MGEAEVLEKVWLAVGVEGGGKCPIIVAEYM